MIPVDAVARMNAAGAPVAIHLVSPVAGAPLALELVKAALDKAAPGDGVFRIRVGGQPRQPQVDISRVATAAQHFLCATVERQADDAVTIGSVFVSPAPGKIAPDPQRTQDLLAEAAAAASPKLALHAPAVVELVLDA